MFGLSHSVCATLQVKYTPNKSVTKPERDWLRTDINKEVEVLQKVTLAYIP